MAKSNNDPFFRNFDIVLIFMFPVFILIPDCIPFVFLSVHGLCYSIVFLVHHSDLHSSMQSVQVTTYAVSSLRAH